MFPGVPVGTSIQVIPDEIELLILAVPEDALPTIAEALVRRFGSGLKGTAVGHLSGSVSADVLLPVKKKGGVTFSLHPIQAFPATADLDERRALLRGISYGFEGDDRAIPIARQITRRLGGRFVRVPKKGKIAYHLACVFASNFIMALHEAARRLTATAGGTLRMEDLHPLMESALRQVLRHGAARAMTGPVVRGSRETLRRHMRQLQRSNPELAAAYSALSSIIVETMLHHRRLKSAKAAGLTAILRGRTRRNRRTNSKGAYR